LQLNEERSLQPNIEPFSSPKKWKRGTFKKSNKNILCARLVALADGFNIKKGSVYVFGREGAGIGRESLPGTILCISSLQVGFLFSLYKYLLIQKSKRSASGTL
jgi:hypothetical protein